MSARKRFRSDDKYGRQLSSFINLFFTFLSDLLQLHCQEFDDTGLLMNKNYSNHVTSMAVQGS